MKKFLHQEEFIEVGFARKPYGFKGDVKLAITDIYEEDVQEAEFLFIEQKGLKVPFKIVENNDLADITVRLDYIHSPEELEPIIGQKIFLLSKEIKLATEYLAKNKESDELVGFFIVDHNSEQKFEILRLEEFPQQLMAVILKDNQEKFIPLNDQFIKEVKKEAKEILMELPEGILEL